MNNLKTAAFDSLTLDLPQSGLYGIIGRNGAGKSTLFTAINGEMRYEGEVVVSGGSYNGRVAYVPSLDIFDNNLTATDHIKLLRDDEWQSASQFMKIFQAERFFDKRIKTYSLGMKEILAFIFLVSVHSDVIIVDELMNGLDNAMRETAFGVLKNLAREKIILLTSHILEEVEKYCDKVYFLAREGFFEVSDFEEAKRLVQENEVFT